MMETTRLVWRTEDVKEEQREKIQELAQDILIRVQVVNDMFRERVVNDPLLRNQLQVRLSNIDTLFSKFCYEYSGEYGFIYAPIKLQLLLYSTSVEEFISFIKNELGTLEKKHRFRFSSIR